MKKPESLEDLKYRKLYLRTEIFKKEQKIQKQLESLRKQLHSPAIKNELVKSAISNPSLIINVARITYKFVQKWKKRRRRKKKK